MPARLEPVPQGGEVVDLAVEDGPDGAVLVGQRLMPAGQVDDREPAEPERGVGVAIASPRRPARGARAGPIIAARSGSPTAPGRRRSRPRRRCRTCSDPSRDASSDLPSLQCRIRARGMASPPSPAEPALPRIGAPLPGSPLPGEGCEYYIDKTWAVGPQRACCLQGGMMRRCREFTLIELLMVIAVLIGLLLNFLFGDGSVEVLKGTSASALSGPLQQHRQLLDSDFPRRGRLGDDTEADVPRRDPWVGPFLLGILLVSLAAGQHERRPTSRPRPRPGRGPGAADIRGIENVFRLSPRLYSGGDPHGAEAFAALKALGIKTIISVDGATPDVEAARKLGLRYVHLPIGYDGVPREQAVRIVKAVKTLPGPGVRALPPRQAPRPRRGGRLRPRHRGMDRGAGPRLDEAGGHVARLPGPLRLGPRVRPAHGRGAGAGRRRISRSGRRSPPWSR